jgi:hypothetical protein
MRAALRAENPCACRWLPVVLLQRKENERMIDALLLSAP